MPTFDFVVTKLIGDNFLIKGQDVAGNTGSTLLHSESWAAYLRGIKQAELQEAFDQKVRDHFKPISDAADALAASQPKDWGTIVVVEGAPGVVRQGIDLDDDGKLLRIAAEQGDLLRWVDDHTLGAIEE